MYVFLYVSSGGVQAQKWWRQRNYDLRVRQKTRIEHRPPEGRLTEIRLGLNRTCRPGTANIFCVVVPGRQPETRV